MRKIGFILFKSFDFADQNIYHCRVDPDEMVHNEPSHQDLHCLPSGFLFLNDTSFAIVDMSEVKMGGVNPPETRG